MSEIQHKSLRDEILFVIGCSSIALNSGEIYERCKLAEETRQVSNALFQLKDIGKIVAVGEGRPRYKLADGVAIPAPAGNAATEAAPAVAPTLEIPTLGDPGIGLGGAAGKTQRAKADKPEPTDWRAKGREEAAHRAASTGGKVEVHLSPASASLADAIIAASREQLAPRGIIVPDVVQPTRWRIDQDGGVELAHPDASDTITLSADQARRLAEMVLAVHEVLEAFE